MSEVDDQRYIRKLESERDALKAELKRFEEWEVDRATVEGLRADNKRLRAELAAEKKLFWDSAQPEQLTELSEAAETAAKCLEEFAPHLPRCEHDDYERRAWEAAKQLRAVLAKRTTGTRSTLTERW